MSKPAKTIYVFAFYMVFEVVILLLSPEPLLKMSGIEARDVMWLRVIAGIVAGLTIYYFVIARREMRELFPVTVYERTTVCAATVFVYAFNHAPFMVLLVGVVDFLGALWTWWAIKNDGPQR